MDSLDQALVGILHRRRIKRIQQFQMPCSVPVKKRKTRASKKTKESKVQRHEEPSVAQDPQTTHDIHEWLPYDPPTAPETSIIDLTQPSLPTIAGLRMVINRFLNMNSHGQMTLRHLKVMMTDMYPELDKDVVFTSDRWKRFLKWEVFVRINPCIPDDTTD